MNKPLFPDIVVDGERISQAAIAAEAQHHPAPKGKPGLSWRRAAEALVVRALLLHEAARRGLTAVPIELGEGRVETEEDALVRVLLEDSIVVEMPEEAALKAIYEKDPTAFVSPTLWEVSHILVAADPGDMAKTEAARAKAKAISENLCAEPGAFADLARQESDCASKKNGGALGQLGPGDAIAEFEAALDSMVPGEITRTPVESRFGFHIVRLDARAEGRPLPYASAKEQIAEAFEKSAWAGAAQKFVSDLAASAVVEGIDLRRD